MTNPLLGPVGLPAFDRLEASHVEPAMRQHLAQLERDFAAFEAGVGGASTYDAVVGRLSDIAEPMGWAWGVVNHLLGVRNSDALRAAHQAVQGDVVALWLKLAQSRPVYQALKRLSGLGEVEARVVAARVRDAELSGVGLDGEAKAAFLKNQQELSELATRFGNQVLDATKAFALDLTSPAEVEGLPASALAGA
ncbi:MAG: M3 family peptidase, partial [Planctomycetes bacterium]|nr:M3 family peptidase [Planctomycetota bacterium]